MLIENEIIFIHWNLVYEQLISESLFTSNVRVFVCNFFCFYFACYLGWPWETYCGNRFLLTGCDRKLLAVVFMLTLQMIANKGSWNIPETRVLAAVFVFVFLSFRLPWHKGEKVSEWRVLNMRVKLPISNCYINFII